MGKKKIIMLPATQVDLTTVNYNPGEIEAPDLNGIWLKIFVMLLDIPLIGPLIVAYLKKQNKFQQMLRETVIPEPPMFRPEFPPQEQEPGVIHLTEDGKSQDRVDSAMTCLPQYDPASSSLSSTPSFRYWKIRDYAYSYRSKITTPLTVAEYVISAIEEFSNKKPPAPLLVSFDAADVRKQAADSTKRFEQGKPLSGLDGIFMAIKDDIDCYPHQSKGGTTWFHEVHTVEKDAVCVSRLRSCGVILVGKANMHEFGQGTTGNNINNGRRAMYYHMEVFKKVDVIITPTTGMTAPVIRPNSVKTGETNMKVTGNLMRFILAGNLLGLPAISVPVGYDKNGLPIGLQIIGRPWGEATILRLAAAIQGLRDETKKPLSYFNILNGN